MSSSEVSKMLVPVILSGGSGTRLWPVSRRAHPKPFMKLVDGESLAEKTFRRALGIAGESPVLTVTSRDYYFYTRDLYDDVDGKEHGHPFLLEPTGRNTAPAIALAALYVQEVFGPDALLLILPADHLIRDVARFQAAVSEARELAGRDYLVTFGIHPTHAETGYGYIRRGAPIERSSGHEVAAFVEKPDEATAGAYVESGEYGWNSGMFCFGAGAYLDALTRHAPEIAECTRNCWESMDAGEQPMEIPLELFSTCPSVSIDYAVMEKASNCAVVGGDFGWSDIGSWKAMSELYESDEAGNRIHGKAILVESTNCFVRSEDRVVAAIGLDNVVIIDTGDAILVADRERVQDVKEVVNQLSDLKHEAAEFHKTVFRPWGS